MIRYETQIRVGNDAHYLVDGVTSAGARILNNVLAIPAGAFRMAVDLSVYRAVRKKDTVIVTVSRVRSVELLRMTHLDALCVIDWLELVEMRSGLWTLPSWGAHDKGIIIHMHERNDGLCRLYHRRMYQRNSYNVNVDKVFDTKGDFFKEFN